MYVIFDITENLGIRLISKKNKIKPMQCGKIMHDYIYIRRSIEIKMGTSYYNQTYKQVLINIREKGNY